MFERKKVQPEEKENVTLNDDREVKFEKKERYKVKSNNIKSNNYRMVKSEERESNKETYNDDRQIKSEGKERNKVKSHGNQVEFKLGGNKIKFSTEHEVGKGGMGKVFSGELKVYERKKISLVLLL